MHHFSCSQSAGACLVLLLQVIPPGMDFSHVVVPSMGMSLVKHPLCLSPAEGLQQGRPWRPCVDRGAGTHF